MDYNQEWEDMKVWLQKGIRYLEERKGELEGRDHIVHSHQEFHRVKGKLDGLKTTLEHMEQSERMNQQQEEIK